MVCTAAISKTFAEDGGCGKRGSAERSEPEYLADRLSLERMLFDGGLSHCDYALRRACLDWEADRPDAGGRAFEMAQEFCDDKAAAERGEVASALAREDFGEAFAAYARHASEGGADSLAVAEYAPAAYSGLSLTSYPPRGPVTYKLPRGRLDPDAAWRLSLLPGLGFLYVGEPKAAASHFFLSLGFAALSGWSAYRGFKAPDRDGRMVAWMDFGLVTTLFLQRYYLGGMREARREAQVKNRREGLDKMAAMAGKLDPFAAPEAAPAPP